MTVTYLVDTSMVKSLYLTSALQPLQIIPRISLLISVRLNPVCHPHVLVRIEVRQAEGSSLIELIRIACSIQTIDTLPLF